MWSAGMTVDQEAGSGKASPGGRGLITGLCFHAGLIIAWSSVESRLETKSFLSVPHLETSPASIFHQSPFPVSLQTPHTFPSSSRILRERRTLVTAGTQKGDLQLEG